MYKICSIEQIILNKYANKSENDDIPQVPETLRFAPIIFFAFLIDIINNIITYSPYSLYYVTRTSANDSAVYWSHDFRLYRVTTILHDH